MGKARAIIAFVTLVSTLGWSVQAGQSWEKRWWLEKTVRVLRGGEGLTPKDPVSEWLALSEQDLVRKLLADPRFGDMALDFNMYFMGFRADHLRNRDGSYTAHAFEQGNSVASVQALLKNADYLKLFELEGDYFFPAMDDDQSADRKRLIKEVDDTLGDFIKFAKSSPKPKPDKFCKTVGEYSTVLTDLQGEIEEVFDDALAILERTDVVPEEFDACDPSDLDMNEYVEYAEEIRASFKKAFTEIMKHERVRYNPKSIADFKPFNLNTLPDSPRKWVSFSGEQAVALANSSTNLNRRRGAYFLKRFFCDDLTPVGFEDPGQHTGGAHGSQTSCFACHYKLDPMSGFFRNFGGSFQDYSKSDTIYFDDMVETDRKEYEKNWNAKPGAPRKFNVGYVRTPNPAWESQNMYGETLADLTKILREAPEVKRCMMKRLFEYVIAEKQTIDGGFLNHLSTQFEAEAKVNSSQAFKNAVERLVLSQSFKQMNPDPEQCYDFGPTGRPHNAPPCRVDFILRENCTQCHDTNNPRKGLDLTQWVLAPDGVHMTFKHVDGAGNQLPHGESLQRIADRLSTNDPNLRMPRNKHMTSQDRQTLYLFVQEKMK